MPFTSKQNRVFRAIAHGFKPKKKGLRSISQSQARDMAAEGIKKDVGRARRSRHNTGHNTGHNSAHGKDR